MDNRDMLILYVMNTRHKYRISWIPDRNIVYHAFHTMWHGYLT